MPAKRKPRDDYSSVVAILAKTRADIGVFPGHDKWKKKTDEAIAAVIVQLTQCPKLGQEDHGSGAKNG